MSDVKRYSVMSDSDGYSIEPFDLAFVSGPVAVVLSSDYDALAAENATLRQRVAELQALIADLDSHEGAEGWSEGMNARIEAAMKESAP